MLGKNPNKIKNVDNISTWTDASINYAQVLIENHPQKARELFKYITVIKKYIAQHITLHVYRNGYNTINNSDYGFLEIR